MVHLSLEKWFIYLWKMVWGDPGKMVFRLQSGGRPREKWFPGCKPGVGRSRAWVGPREKWFSGCKPRFVRIRVSRHGDTLPTTRHNDLAGSAQPAGYLILSTQRPGWPRPAGRISDSFYTTTWLAARPAGNLILSTQRPGWQPGRPEI